ncbi:MAG: ABC transporter ATP-binding protein [Nitrospiraceae bacterium]|nr:ABC transporter ATP-binding protein [Nitrospiraceae bacterium]
MIRLEGVEKYYGSTPVLKGVNLFVERGEFISVMGSSGSGKSTLLNLIGGMDLPDRGSIAVNGKDLSSFSDDQLTAYRRQKVGFIFQFFNLLPNITVFENVRMPLLLNDITDSSRVLRYLERVGIADKAGRFPRELSGGEQQRVAIARALVHAPEVILADEPTGSLDTKNSGEVMDLLGALAAEEGKTVVLVTHEDYIARYSRKMVRIRDGVILP